MLREALEIWRKTLPADHVNIGATLNNLGVNLHLQGKFADAEPALREAVEMGRRGTDERQLAPRLGNLANCSTTRASRTKRSA
jgi:Tfp pilus assembly protein PilF